MSRDDDRCIHAVLASGREVVRYNKAGKWYVECAVGREQISLMGAVHLACLPGATRWLGRPGGNAFDRAVRKTLVQPKGNR